MINRLAWYQLTNEKLRLLAAVAGITFIALLQLMQFGFQAALYTTAIRAYEPLLADIMVVSAQYEYIVSPGTFARQRLYQALMHKDVHSVAALNTGLAPFLDDETHRSRQIIIFGFNPNEMVFDLEAINADVAAIRVADAAILDAQSPPEYRPIIARLRRDNRLHSELAGRRVDITGLFDLGVAFTGNAHMITSDTTFRRIFRRSENSIEVGLVRVNPGSDVESVRDALAATLPRDVRVVTKPQFLDLEQDYWARTQPVGFIFNSGLLVALVVGAVIVYQILYTDVTGHLSEYATLKAMGYRDRALYMVVIQEALILSVLAFPVGLALAQGIYYVTREATGLPVVMTGTRIIVVFSLTVTMCTLSGLLAMRKLRSADPADAF